MKVVFHSFSHSTLQGMCPRPNLWRQLGFDLALQSRATTRAKSVSSEPASRPATAQDDKPSEVNPTGSLQTSFLEKHARELLTQLLSGSRSSGNSFASVQVVSGNDAGEITLQAEEREYALHSIKVEEDTLPTSR